MARRLWLCCLLLASLSTLSMAQSQSYDFGRTFTAGADNTDASCITAPLGATCIGFTIQGHVLTIAPTTEGHLWGCQANTIFHKKFNGAWAVMPGSCRNLEGSIAAASDNADEVVKIGTDNFIYKWNGSGWTILGGSNVQASYIASGTDFDLWIKDGLSGHAKQWNGTSWGVRSTTFIPDTLCVGDSAHVYATSAGSLYKWTGSAWSVITGTPTGLSGCAVQWNEGIFVVAHNNDDVYHQANFTGTWKLLKQEATVNGSTWTIHCSTYNSCYLTDQDISYPTNNVFHLIQGNFTLRTAVTGSYASFCANQPNGCPVGSSHSGNNQVTFQSGTNGLRTTISNVSPQTAWNLVSTGNPNPACNIFFLPGDARCIPSEPKAASCAVMGPLAIAKKPKSDVDIVDCFANPILPSGTVSSPIAIRPFGYKKGVTVTVYFDVGYQSPRDNAKMDSICAGIQSWTPIVGITFTCDHAHISVPTSSTPKPWYFIGDDPDTTTSVTNPCANILVSGVCPGAPGTPNKWQVMTGGTLLGMAAAPSGMKLQKIAAHEMGHLNWLDDCANCPDGLTPGVKSSIMFTPISSTGGNLPPGPTDCDELWYMIWYRKFAH